MAPRRIPNVLEVDVRDAKRLTKYAAISPDRLDLPQSNGGFSFTKRSDPSYYESVDDEASQLQVNTTVMPVNYTTFTPMEAIPEEIEDRMDLDWYGDLAEYEAEQEGDFFLIDELVVIVYVKATW